METMQSTESQMQASVDEAHQEERYTRLSLLGQGTFGKAYLVESKINKKHYVCKEINLADMNQADSDKAFREALILSELSHPNIIKFQEVYRTLNNKLKIIMEYADGGDLSTKIKQCKEQGKMFSESQILAWFTQVCLAIKHCHDRKIIHRDIKGQNVFMMKNGMAKLGDFGISTILTKTLEKVNTIVGTPYYLSPQIIENKPYSFKSDIWSLGVLLYQMCTFKTPFTGTSLPFLALKIVKGSYQSLPNTFSYEIRSLIKSMLHTDQNRRPTVHQILKTKLISGRIKDFLTDSQRKTEFSHTILHDKHIHASKLNKLITSAADQPFNYMLLKHTDSEILNGKEAEEEKERQIMEKELNEQNEEKLRIEKKKAEDRERLRQERLREQRQREKEKEAQNDVFGRKSSVSSNQFPSQEKLDLFPSSRRLFPTGEQNTPGMKSPQNFTKQPQGKIYKNPTISGAKPISEAKPNLDGLLDIKSNPLVAHPMRAPMKVYTPQVVKKQPDSRSKQLRAARKTQDLNFKKKPNQKLTNLKRNPSTDKIQRKSVTDKNKEKVEEKQEMRILLNDVLIPPKPIKSENSKKQGVVKRKNNSVGEIKVSKKDSKVANKGEKIKVEEKKPLIPKGLKGLEIKSEQVKKQEAVQKQKLVAIKSKQKQRKRANSIQKKSQKSLERNNYSAAEPPMSIKILSPPKQKQTEKEQKLSDYQNQVFQSQFEEQKFEIPQDYKNQTYSFPNQYQYQQFQEEVEEQDISNATGISIPEMKESNTSSQLEEEKVIEIPESQNEGSEFNQMINQMFQIMNSSQCIPNISSVTEMSQESDGPSQIPPDMPLPTSFIDQQNDNQSMFGGNLTYTNTLNTMAGLQCFQNMAKLQDLRITFEKDFGFQKFLEIYRMITKEVEAQGLEFDDKELYEKILSLGVKREILDKHFSYLVTLVILENPLVSNE